MFLFDTFKRMLNKKKINNCFELQQKMFLKIFSFSFISIQTESKNMLTNQPMYAVSFFFNSGWNKRSVFLWSLKTSVILNKLKGKFLYSK